MSWICPNCGKVLETSEPVWTWVKIQGEEAIHVPTCPECGYEVEEADECPLCGEPMERGKPMCYICWNYLINKLEWAVDGVATKNTPRRVKWEAINDMAVIMCDRFWREDRKK